DPQRSGGGPAGRLPGHTVHVPVARTMAMGGPAVRGGGADLAAPGAAGRVDRRRRGERGVPAGGVGGRDAAFCALLRPPPVVATAGAGSGGTIERRLDLQTVLLRAGRPGGRAGPVVGQGGAGRGADGSDVPQRRGGQRAGRGRDPATIMRGTAGAGRRRSCARRLGGAVAGRGGRLARPVGGGGAGTAAVERRRDEALTLNPAHPGV